MHYLGHKRLLLSNMDVFTTMIFRIGILFLQTLANILNLVQQTMKQKKKAANAVLGMHSSTSYEITAGSSFKQKNVLHWAHKIDVICD